MGWLLGGGWDWLPTAPNEDTKLRAAFHARDQKAFNDRAKGLREASDDTGNASATSQQWVACTMRKGDLIIVRDSYSATVPTRRPTKYLIGVFSTEIDDPNGTVWGRCCDYGVTQAMMFTGAEADRPRLWRPVTWVREGNWQGELADSTVTAMAGVQAKTITVFTESMHAVFDMLKKSRPLTAAAPSQLSKQPVPVIALDDSDDEQEPPSKRPKSTSKPVSGTSPSDASRSEARSSADPSPTHTARPGESDDLEAKLTYFKGLYEKGLLDREVWVKKQEQLLELDK